LADYFSYTLDNGDTCNEYGTPGWITFSCTMGDDTEISNDAFVYDSESAILVIAKNAPGLEGTFWLKLKSQVIPELTKEQQISI